MSSAAVTYNFTNGTTADATQVNQNFTDLVSIFNSHALHKDTGAIDSASYFADGVITPAKLAASLPRGLMGRTVATANVNDIAGTETDIITLPAITPVSATRVLLLTFYVGSLAADAVTSGIELRFKEGGTQLGRGLKKIVSTVNIGEQATHISCLVVAPTVASHTYKLTGQRYSGTGLIDIEASATSPMYITVEDIGSSV